MHVRRLIPVVSLILIAGVVACDSDDNTAPVVPKETFVATLSGTAERPNPVTTTATGSAVVTIEDTNTISFSVSVAGIDSAMFGHFHAGTVDVSGPVMSFLFNIPATPTARGFTGTIATGVATRDTTKFSGSFKFDSLLARIRAGTAYVNVHTKKNPGGEIRGQLTKQQ
jgi:CHRD domain-containing protein